MGISGLQLMITVVVMLGVAGLALLVDFLRARNLQLQQTVSELRGHNEMKQARRALEPLMKPPVPASPVTAAPMPGRPVAVEEPAPVRPAVEVQVPAEQPQPEKELVRAAKPVQAQRSSELQRSRDAAAELTSRTGRRRSPRPEGTPVHNFDNLSSKAALEQWLTQRAAQRAARNMKNASPKPAAPPHAAEDSLTTNSPVTPKPANEIVASVEVVPAAETRQVEPIAEEVALPAVDEAPPVIESDAEVIAEVIRLRTAIQPVAMAFSPVGDAGTAAAVAFAPEVAIPAVEIEIEHMAEETAALPSGLPPVQIDAALWETLFGPSPEAEDGGEASSQIQPVPCAEPEVIFEVIRGAGSLNLTPPAGLHEKPVLTRLLMTPKPFTGLVVSVGVNSQDSGCELSEDLLLAIESYVASMLGENDFACRTADDEFLMICPGENPAAAQRRLNQISERLWDYQLRSIGTFSVLFSSGGTRVQSEPLADAIASAEERMKQTRRYRASSAGESLPRKKAV